MLCKNELVHALKVIKDYWRDEYPNRETEDIKTFIEEAITELEANENNFDLARARD